MPRLLCDEIRKTVAGCDVSFCLIDELSGDIDVLINATPIGMFPKIENQPVSDSVINRCANVFDAVYNPLETMLVKKAKDKRCNSRKRNGNARMAGSCFSRTLGWLCL